MIIIKTKKSGRKNISSSEVHIARDRGDENPSLLVTTKNTINNRIDKISNKKKKNRIDKKHFWVSDLFICQASNLLWFYILLACMPESLFEAGGIKVEGCHCQ